MSFRLLSFLTDFQAAVLADNPAMDGAAWQMQRTVNFQQGLARLRLALGTAGRPPDLAGEVFLQSYVLADGMTCVKAVLGWNGSPAKATHMVFERCDVNWPRAARTLAAEWNAGPPAIAPAETPEPVTRLTAAAG